MSLSPLNKKNKALLIPTSSIIRRFDQEIALVKNSNDGVAEKTITTGISQNGLTEVLSGLNQGDQVAGFGGK